MSDDHKAALAQGREEGRVVRRYLEALEAHQPRRGRPRDPERTAKRLQAIETAISAADPLTRLHLIQERRNLRDELMSSPNGNGHLDMESLEADFVDVAASYGQRKGISYSAWREVNVPPEVLRRAGIARSA